MVLYPPGKPYCPFGLREEEWLKHVLICGMTGAGKTNLTFEILRQLHNQRVPFLLMDWKRGYRDLRQRPEFRDLQVFTVGRSVVPFKFNPLIPPPGVDVAEWMNLFTDVICHVYFEGHGAEDVIREALAGVYEECGWLPHGSQRVKTPTVSMVLDAIRKKRSEARARLWKQSAERAFNRMVFRYSLGPVTDVEEALDPDIFLTEVILELDSLSNDDKKLIAEALILWLYEYRKTQPVREKVIHALVIEEAHHILSRKKEANVGEETIMETCLRQIREFGVPVVVIDQEPTKMSDSIKANTYTKICFQLGNGSDALDMALSMGLDEEERDYINLLDVGKAIVVLKGRVFTPLYVQFPRFELRKGRVTDEDLRHRP